MNMDHDFFFKDQNEDAFETLQQEYDKRKVELDKRGEVGHFVLFAYFYYCKHLLIMKAKLKKYNEEIAKVASDFDVKIAVRFEITTQYYR